MPEVKLNREAATALLKEAHRDLEIGAEELYGVGDEAQRPKIEACVEVVGRLSHVLRPYAWPREDNGPHGSRDQWFAEFDFSATVMAWVERGATEQAEYLYDLDRGASEIPDPGYLAEQTYLLHVQRGIVEQQRETVAA